jgi:hypothetical protein
MSLLNLLAKLSLVGENHPTKSPSIAGENHPHQNHQVTRQVTLLNCPLQSKQVVLNDHTSYMGTMYTLDKNTSQAEAIATVDEEYNIEPRSLLIRLAMVQSGLDCGLFWRLFKKTGPYGPALRDYSPVPKILDRTVRSGLFMT